MGTLRFAVRARRVFGDLGRLLGADRQGLQFHLSGVDDLVRGLSSSGREGNQITSALWLDFCADAHLTGSFDEVSHLFVNAVIVQGEGALSRWYGGQVVTELPGADQRSGMQPGLESMMTF